VFIGKERTPTYSSTSSGVIPVLLGDDGDRGAIGVKWTTRPGSLHSHALQTASRTRHR